MSFDTIGCDRLTFDIDGEIINSIERIAILLTKIRALHPHSFILHTKPTFCAFELFERRPIMTPVVAAKKLSKFDPKTFLSTINGGRKIVAFAKKQTIFAQGDPSYAVFYIQKGKVKLTVVSNSGKEATIGILNAGDFFGEGCLTGQILRVCSAIAMTDCSVMRIEKKSMVEVLHREKVFRPVRGLLADTEHPIRRGVR